MLGQYWNGSETDRICFTVCRRQYLVVVIVHPGWSCRVLFQPSFEAND